MLLTESKIKSMLKAELDIVHNKIDTISKEVQKSIQQQEAQTHELLKLGKHIETISLQQASYTQSVEKEIKEIQKLADNFTKSISSFDNLRNRMDSLIYKKIDEVVEGELKIINKKIQQFEGLDNHFSSVKTHLDEIKKDIDTFNKAAKAIKEVDFSLHKHAKDLDGQDQQIRRLEKENEKLKDIMATMKRRR